MAGFRFSKRAEDDLLEIGIYTVRVWGEATAIRYLDELETCCKQLGDNVELGRLCEEIRPGLRRFEHGRHVIFYRGNAKGIVVSRILHQRMLPQRHAMED